MIKLEEPTRKILTFGLPGTAPVMKEVPAWQAPVHSEKQIEMFRTAPAPSLPTPVPVNIPGEPIAPVYKAVDFSSAGRQAPKDAATVAILEKEAKAIAEAKQVEEMFGLGKKIAKSFTDNLVEKTVAKSGLSEAEKLGFKTTFDNALAKSNFDEVISTVDKVQTMVVGAAATALLPGLSKITGKTTSGPVANLDKAAAGSGPVAASQASLPTSSSMPGWLLPVAIVAGVLLFGKKLLRL